MLRHLTTVQEELRNANTNLERQGRRAGPGEHAALRNEPAEERLPGHDEPRAAHAAQRHHRLFSDVLGSIASLDEKQKRYVKNIQKSGKVLLDMINDILDLAKIESGKMEVRLSEFRIDARRPRRCAT